MLDLYFPKVIDSNSPYSHFKLFDNLDIYGIELTNELKEIIGFLRKSNIYFRTFVEGMDDEFGFKLQFTSVAEYNGTWISRVNINHEMLINFRNNEYRYMLFYDYIKQHFRNLAHEGTKIFNEVYEDEDIRFTMWDSYPELKKYYHRHNENDSFFLAYI